MFRAVSERRVLKWMKLKWNRRLERDRDFFKEFDIPDEWLTWHWWTLEEEYGRERGTVTFDILCPAAWCFVEVEC